MYDEMSSARLEQMKESLLNGTQDHFLRQ